VVTAVERARAAAATVRDPEIRVLTIDELGILRGVTVAEDGTVVVNLTPTYVGCPAMDTIRADVVESVRGAGFEAVEVAVSWSPAWTTDWLDDTARDKLRAAGIAPPASPAEPRFTDVPPHRRLPMLSIAPRCPRCDSADTTELSRFGSTACKALWRCDACLEPFDHVREHL
jgi:ring-1,2-phenylacetyl-CoA epoxidase subunit PaaD